MMAAHALSIAQKDIIQVDNMILTHKHKYNSGDELSRVFKLDDEDDDIKEN
jgi:hypothetical protein